MSLQRMRGKKKEKLAGACHWTQRLAVTVTGTLGQSVHSPSAYLRLVYFPSPCRDKSKCLLCNIYLAKSAGQARTPTTTNTLHAALTCGGMQTLQAPIARQDPSQSAAQAASVAAATHASAHPETSVHHAVHPSAYRASSVRFGPWRQP